MQLCCFESKYAHQIELDINLNLLFIDVVRMQADHLGTIPCCEGMRRYTTRIPGVDILNQSLTDEDVLINHYTTSIHSGICSICWETGARFDNPTCLTCHALCGNCVGKVMRCPTCRQEFSTRHRILAPDMDRNFMLI